MKREMKKIYIVLLSFVFGACADQLDLKPQQNLDESMALANDANVKKALAGAYDALSGFDISLAIPSSGTVWGGDLMMFSELLAANAEITWVGTFPEPREIFGKNILTTNRSVRDNWTSSYNTINIANNVLSAIDKVFDEDQDRVEGEALFIRGVVYFEIVRFYAKDYNNGNPAANPGVPIVLEPTRSITAESNVSRATVAQVYQQVIDDLTSAEALLPAGNGFYANKVAAAAMLSRLYLQQGDFARARDAANRAIEYDEFALTETFAEAFNNEENSSEDIFALQVSAQDGNNNMQTYWSIPAFGARDGDVEINAKHLNLYEADDDRLEMFYTGNGAVRTGKWREQNTVMPIIRLAEMYITRAETNFRLGTTVGDTPLNDVNLLRNRAGLDDLIVLTIADILHERKVELAHEGFAIHDVKRLQLTVDGLPSTANDFIFPIPQREINANRSLVQNDGYN
jgi:tetratricopeptide (TPR) repeat protein